MKSHSSGLGIVAICIAAFLWGFDGVVLTPRLYNLPIPFVVFLIHAVPFVLMQPFLWRSYRAIASLDRNTWITLGLVALSGGVLGTLGIVTALFLVDFHQLSVVVLLQKLQPVFAILLAAVLLKEKISARFIRWTAVAIVGGYLLTFGTRLPDFSAGRNATLAALFALLAAAAFGSATVFGKKLLGSLDFWQTTFGRYGATTILMAIFLLASGLGFPLSQTTSTNWFIILTIAFTTGTGATVLYYWGLTRVRASVAALGELSLPIGAVLLDYVVNGSRLTVSQLLGAALMIGAISQVSRRQN
jgi:drug/metabolite transporter (DMT)-like permease